jgi:hypothetical protein
MNEKECHVCNEVFEYSDADIITGCDIIEGQYIEYDATMCPICGCENGI